MTTFNFSITVPDYITSNKEWFGYIAEICSDLSELYRDAANHADDLQEDHPFYTSMLPVPITEAE